MPLMEWAQAPGTLTSSPSLKMSLLGASGNPHPWLLWAQEGPTQSPLSSPMPGGVWALSRPLREGPREVDRQERRTGKDLERQWGLSPGVLTLDPGQLCPQWLLSLVSPEHLGLLAHLRGALHGHSGAQGKRADLQPGRATLIININFIVKKSQCCFYCLELP